MDFVARCARSAGLDLAADDVVVDQRGMQHLVLLDHRTGSAYRFPRTAPAPDRLRDSATRLELLGEIGLPVPAVLEVHESSVPGVGHVRLSLLAGQALDTVDTDAMNLQAQSRLVAELVELLDRLGRLPVGRWPGDPLQWERIWAGLADDAAAAPGLPTDVREHARHLACRAAATASTTQIRVFHGDLGGVNCRIDPSTGSVLGVLDWDAAALGDPATDVAALLAGLGPRTAAHARRAAQRWADDELRYADYLETWPLQYYLWSTRSGGPGDRRSALDMLTRQARSAVR